MFAPRPFDYRPELIRDPDLLYEDDWFVIVDKPEGLLTVPGKAEGLKDCLEARLRARFRTARIVHRLDKDTSGVMVLALGDRAQRHIGRQFEKRRLEKTYEAVVAGVPRADRGRIDLPIWTDPVRRPAQRVDYVHGRPAVTDWEVVGRTDRGTRVRLHPLTGRSHQLRLHLAQLGHPILGDAIYAPDAVFEAAPRLFLHATRLKLRHPEDGRWMTFESAAPF